MKPDNDTIRVRRNFRVKWYRSPVDKFVLRELHERSDIKGFFQTLGADSVSTFNDIDHPHAVGIAESSLSNVDWNAGCFKGSRSCFD